MGEPGPVQLRVGRAAGKAHYDITDPGSTISQTGATEPLAGANFDLTDP